MDDTQAPEEVVASPEDAAQDESTHPPGSVEAEQVGDGAEAESTEPQAPARPDVEAISVEELRSLVVQQWGELDTTTTARDEHLEDLKRLKAEFDNFRKRSARERQDMMATANVRLVEALLPALDSLEMAFLSSTEDDALYPGLEAVCSQLIEILKREGLDRIEPVDGDDFDPESMEPVAQVPATDEAPAATVSRMFRPGYRMNDKLLRAAMVEVRA